MLYKIALKLNVFEGKTFKVKLEELQKKTRTGF